ncbi:tyrosinase domain protein [Annulohypoxylon nitens]|nr:tyrosinase domain protein [Annulohypoxylon nitens]
MESPPTYPITGIKTDGDSPIRKDIDDWYQEQTDASGDRIQLTLFVEALTKIQARPLSDERSYFRLAGIHSAPWTSWDYVTPSGTGSEGSFCTHNNYTFPTWHRVYMTLFEQVVYETMIDYIDEAAGVSDAEKDKWKREADQWRLPYWDFARFAKNDDGTTTGKLSGPILATLPQVEVKELSTGKPVVKTNPLYKFEAEKLMGQLEPPYTINDQPDGSDTIPFSKCQSTTKYGLRKGEDQSAWADAGQNWKLVVLALNEHPWYQNQDNIPNLQDMVFRLLRTENKSWSQFSTTRDGDSDPAAWMNLEAIHNNIHNWVGGSFFDIPEAGKDKRLWGCGHMSEVPVAAFDPIFWVYHCNIDRLTAIWQSLNPENWFDGDSESSLYNELTPFHKDKEATTFKSNDVRDWRKLGYEYAITKKDTEDIKKDIDELYGNESLTRDSVPKRDYILSIRYDRYALGGSPFLINIFFEDVDRKDFYDTKSKNFIGSVFNFSANIHGTDCGNCIRQQQDSVRSVSQLPATFAVEHYQKDKEYPEVYYVVVNSLGKV